MIIQFIQRDNSLDERVRVPKVKINPKNEPVGHYTGRCMKCESNDLWDDVTAYGCNTCGAVYHTKK